jgi:hypothetical protein
LKEKGCIIDVFQKPYVINPLTVSVNDSGKHRLVLDLRDVNKYVQKQKIKFEGILTAKQKKLNTYLYRLCSKKTREIVGALNVYLSDDNLSAYPTLP